MLTKPDYTYKAYILNNYSNLLKAVRNDLQFSNALIQFNCNGVISHSLIYGSQEPIWDLKDYCYKFGLSKEFDESLRITNAFYHRKVRLNEKISRYVKDYDCTFLTLTFRNDVLDSTSKETRRRYVARYLKSLGVPYIANIDYGDSTDREHYHAIVCLPLYQSNWSYGFSYCEKVRKNGVSSEKLSTYINKLTNHAIKATTKRNALLYSRSTY